MLPDTLTKLIKNMVSENGSSLLIQRRDGHSWKQITWKDFESDTRSVAAFLTGSGFEAGDRAFFESCGGYGGLVSETAVFMLGGVAVSCLPANGSACASVKTAFADSRESALRFISEGAETAIFHANNGSFKPGDAVVDFRAALKFGFLKSRKMTDELNTIFSAVAPHTAAVEFQNGNGDPQALSHKGLMDMLGSGLEKISGSMRAGSQTFNHLPRPDMFSRVARFLSLCVSARSAAAESEEDLFEDMVEVMPTVAFFDSVTLSGIARKISDEDDKSAFGGRLSHIFTDRAPEGETAEFYSKNRVKVSEIF